MFATSGIILSKRPLKDSQWSLSVYTHEFGKLHLLYPMKTKKHHLDIGSAIQIKIHKKNTSHIIQSILKHIPYQYAGHEYSSIEMGLWFFSTLDTILPIGVPNLSLVLELERCAKYISSLEDSLEVAKNLHVFLLRVIVLHGFAITTPSQGFQEFLEKIRVGDFQESSKLLPESFNEIKSRAYIDHCVAYFLSM